MGVIRLPALSNINPVSRQSEALDLAFLTWIGSQGGVGSVKGLPIDDGLMIRGMDVAAVGDFSDIAAVLE